VRHSMRLENLHIVVTGGMGYVGSHVAKTLKAMGARVSIVDRRYNAHVMKFCDHFTLTEYNNKNTLDHYREQQVNGFIHCAGTSLVGPSVLNPSEYYNNNVVKTIDFLDQIRTWDTRPFVVFSSSAATYGTPKTLPIDETVELNPISPYGRTKLFIEQILEDYHRAYGLRSISLRYFNAAGADIWGSELGPEPNDSHLIPKIFEAYQTGNPFTINGQDFNTPDGTCIRDYVHVSDLALAHARCCDALLNNDVNWRINLGTNHGVSNQQMVDAFTNIVGPVDIDYGSRRDGDPDSLVASNRLAKLNLNWEPVYSGVDTLIKSTADWYSKKVFADA